MKKVNLKEVVKDITINAETEEEKAKAIFYFVRDKIEFDAYVGDFFRTAEEVLELGKGSCVTKATLMLHMIRSVEIPARYHFVRIRKEGLKDILHPFVYKFWPETFIHTYSEIKLGKWIDFDATYDKEFHEKLIENKLNFGAEKDKTDLNIDFSINGVKSAQDIYMIEDAGNGDDLQKLKDYVEDLSVLKRNLMPLARWLSRGQIRKIRGK